MGKMFMVAAGMALSALGQRAYAETSRELSFVGCPVARQTDDILCWLVDYNGQQYFLGYQGNLVSVWYPPMLKHKVLVEGAVPAADGSTECGGRKLVKFHSSPVYAIDTSCDTVLPADDRFKTPPGYWHKLMVLTGTGGVQPEGVGFFLNPAMPKTFDPPYKPQQFEVLFDFDYPTARPRSLPEVEAALDYAKKSGGKVEITGYRGATMMSDGSVFAETPGVGKERAALLASTLEGMGLPKNRIVIAANESVVRATGSDDWNTRRAVLSVVP